MSKRYILIDQQDDLSPLLLELARHDRVALDTEADSMHHYREKLSLIQLSMGETHWIVDPLAGLDLDPLMKLLEERELLIHGADYDLRLLYRAHQFRPQHIFDTMLAAQLLGKPRIGLAALAQEICQVVLPKEGQKADWSRRPLSEDLLHYAADDTRYLAQVADTLREELVQHGRLDWHGEICRRQMATAREPRQVSEDEAWRIKGGKHLTGRPAAVLRELWRWREEHARLCDRPPYKIANNEFLLQWTRWVAENPGATLEEAPDRPEWLRGPRLKSFNLALHTGLALQRSHWPGPLPGSGEPRCTREEEVLLRQLLEARDEVAAGLGLDPGVLGPRDALKSIARQHPRTEEELREKSPLMSWQTESLAGALLPLLQADEQAPALTENER